MEDLKSKGIIIRDGVLLKVDDDGDRYLETHPSALEGVTCIGYGAFWGRKALTSIKLPGSVHKIESRAFHGCKSLRSIDIPNGVEYIERYTFCDCESLAEINIPDSVITIEQGAFQGCGSLKKINIPDSVTYLGESVFQGCVSLTSMHIPNGVTTIGNDTFCGCVFLKSIDISEGVTNIGKAAFKGCRGLTSIKLPNGVTTIASNTFSSCLSLTDVTLPSTVNIIWDHAFEGCESLTQMVLPDSVRAISNHVFSGCKALISINIPDGVKSIGDAAFSYCKALEELNIPKSVESIGAYAFSGCKKLKINLEYGDDQVVKNIGDEYCQRVKRTREFLEERDRVGGKFLPHVVVVENLPKEMIGGFYKNSKLWAQVLEEFAANCGKNAKELLYDAKGDFFKVCLISGLFTSENKQNEKALKFIREKIISNFNEETLHEKFTGLDTYTHGFNQKYADFLIENFTAHGFMADEETERDFTTAAYNRFEEIEKELYNKEVHTNTDADRLTQEDIIYLLSSTKYDNVETKQDRDLANLCGRFGYTQSQFDRLKDYLTKGTEIEREGRQSIVGFEDTFSGTDKVTFEVLKKDDPLGAVLGAITNCCQEIDDNGESCMKHGMTNPNGGFVVFKQNGQIVGQSWVWYDEQTHKLCFDNVEVPRSRKKDIYKEGADFAGCLLRVAKAMVGAMAEKGHIVESVTMGKGYNDILDLVRDNYVSIETYIKAVKVDKDNGLLKSSQQVRLLGAEKSLLGKSPSGIYTDTKQGELVIYTSENEDE